MKKLILLGALLAAGSLGLQDVSIGHGGTYRGPGDTVPPGGGGGGGGGGPSTPGPAGPSTPGGGGPSTPGPTAPGTPGGGGGSSGPTTTGGGDSGPDLTTWQFWWGFNKDPYLNLRAKIHDKGVLTGSDEFFTGVGQKTGAKDSLKPSEDTIRNVIVPALLQALETEKQNDILTGAMIALAKIGDAENAEGESQFEEVIKKFLSNGVQEVRETAAIALGILGNPKSIDTLIELAGDTVKGREIGGNAQEEVPYRTRAFATYGLGLVGYRTDDPKLRRTIVGALQKLIEEPRESTRDVKVAAVIAMGLVPIDEDMEVPEDAKTIDATLSRRNQIEFLLEFLKDDKNHFLVRAHAPRALAQLVTGIRQSDGQSRFAPVELELRSKVAQQLESMMGRNSSGEQRELRQSATLALGRLGDCDSGKEKDSALDKKIRQSLIAGVEDPDQQTKFFSLISLAQVGGNPGQGEEPFGGQKEIEDHLLKQLARGASRGRTWAALSLGVYGDLQAKNGQLVGADANAAIRDAMVKITSPQDIGAYALGSALRNDQEAKAGIYSKFQSIADNAARGDLAIALGLLGAREYIEEIVKVVTESKYRPELLKQAAIGLGLLGDKDAVPELLKMLETSDSLATQAAIATALGFIGDSRSVDPLVAMLGNKEVTAIARAFAAVALGNVADKEPLPWNSKISVDINYRANTVTLTGQGGQGLLDIL